MRTAVTNRLAIRNQLYSVESKATTQYIKSGVSFAVSTTPFSFGIWARPNLISGLPTIISQTNGTGLGRAWLYFTGTAWKLTTVLGGTTILGTRVLNNNQWYFFGVSVDPIVKTMDFYVGGNNSFTHDIAVTGMTIEPADGEIWLLENKGLSANFQGLATEYRIFTDRVFTEQEWSDYYFNNSFDKTGLRQELLFTEGTGNSVADTSVNATTASIINTANWYQTTFSKNRINSDIRTKTNNRTVI